MKNQLIQLPRIKKQIILIFFDIIILNTALIISYLLKYELNFNENLILKKNILIPFLSIPFFIKLGLYRSVLKYIGLKTILAAVKAMSFSIFLIYLTFNYVTSFNPLSSSILIIYWFVSISGILLLRYLSYNFLYKKNKGMPIAIYGAGQAGIQLAKNINDNNKYNLICFFDDDLTKSNLNINSKMIFNVESLSEIIKRKKIKIIFLAIPSLSRSIRKKIIFDLAQYPVKVMELPSIDKIIDGDITIDDVIEVKAEDLLGRNEVKEEDLDSKYFYVNKNILITGVGGSIGSEIARQIIVMNPKKIILVDHSEFNLYQINKELSIEKTKIEIIPMLGSVVDELFISSIFKKYSIDLVYHAAAYKHVPMVEKNIYNGVVNNIFGTLNVVESAFKNNVKYFTLISTDKAVKPTNVMGASKRFSELILQAYNTIEKTGTIFSIVRFGNVLDSAGSVLPLFREQIKSGGPVTVTHKKITRFFMSISEAVNLVLNSSTLAKGGEVFILNMGSPVNIYEMAKRMIFLSGLVPYDDVIKEGDIKIDLIGLRPGEKLHEELFINNEYSKTIHPKIFKANEPFLKLDKIKNGIFNLKQAIKKNDEKKMITILKKYIEEY